MTIVAGSLLYRYLTIFYKEPSTICGLIFCATTTPFIVVGGGILWLGCVALLAIILSSFLTPFILIGAFLFTVVIEKQQFVFGDFEGLVHAALIPIAILVGGLVDVLHRFFTSGWKVKRLKPFCGEVVIVSKYK